LPTGNPLQQDGEICVAQWPIPAPDILLGSADQKDIGAGLIAGPGDPQLIIDRELERLQPALAANEDDRCDDKMRADQRLEAGTP
jgi:hypothetical protein